MSDYTCLIGFVGCILLWLLGLYLYPEPFSQRVNYSRGMAMTVPEPWDSAPAFNKVSEDLHQWQAAVFGGEEE